MAVLNAAHQHTFYDCLGINLKNTSGADEIRPLGCRSNVLLVAEAHEEERRVLVHRPISELLVMRKEKPPPPSHWDPRFMLTKSARGSPPGRVFL